MVIKHDTELKPFQLEGVRQIYRFHGRALLADEMGLGKTLQSLYWLKKIPSYRPAVIVCPASLKYSWQSEAMLHFGMRTEVLEGNCNGDDSPLPDKGIIILNYNILPSWLPLLLAARPRALIIDEIHYIKNLRTQRTKATLRLASNAASVVGLSGTPLTNRPIELWSVLRAIRPNLFPSRHKFAWKYCAPKWTPWGWKFEGATNLKQLNYKLRKHVMIRRLKKEVAKELPDKVHKTIVFRLKDYREYDEAQNNFLAWLKKKSPAKAKRAARSETLVKIGYLIRLVCKLKLEMTVEWLREFHEAHPDQKLVAFSMHTFVLEHLKEQFPEAIVVNGAVTGRKREEAVRQFRSHPRKWLFLGNWIAAGVGLNLQVASNVAALDFPWVPADLLQGVDRCHRIGQKFKVIIYYLAALGTIEAKFVTLLLKKSKILDAVLDGKNKMEGLNIFEELLDEITKVKR